ncbi:DUF1553 domain-containing protein [Ravibacter arvi]|uniref:DUF1553 domain-containing protein n=1 Tax=Ravibacter arvi TaxID=2051041 RepID=A0ABP8LKG7_9BACT
MKLKILSWLVAVVFGLLVGCNKSVDLPEEIDRELATIPEEIDYTLHVKPILSDRCFACHGPDQNKRQGGLRLDVSEVAFGKNEESGLTAIVPGNSVKSELVARILTDDPEKMMPTPESHLTLSAQEKAILIRWIEQGAVYKPHWAFVKVQEPEIPENRDKSWAKNDLDRFILAGMEKAGLKPAPEADKTTLLRRVYLDLTGLPPSVEEVDAFLADASPEAYEKVVDRLLASKHYGEHRAVPWLDLARYADTHGYQDDGPRTMWPYRDWVIRAFNENMPFDRFVTWQLAGDLLPNPDREMMLATAFNRNHQQSQEGGIVPEEYRNEYVSDRVNTFGAAFLGLTTECARCHDHKYDPFSQKDYFSLYAFFNNNNENGQIPYNGEASPTIVMPSPEAEVHLRRLTQAKLDAAIIRNETRRTAGAVFEKWLKEIPRQKDSLISMSDKLVGYYRFDDTTGRVLLNTALMKDTARVEGEDSLARASIRKGKFGSSRYIFGENAINFPKPVGWYERNEPFTVSIWLKLHSDQTVGSLIHKSNGVFNGYRGWNVFREADGTFRFTLSNVWPENSIELASEEKVPLNQWVHLVVSYDGLSRASGARMYLNGQEMKVYRMNDHLNQSLLYGKKQSNWGESTMRIGRLADQYTKDFEVDELRIYSRRLNPLEVKSLYTQKDEVLWAVRNNTPETREQLYTYFLDNYHPRYRAALDSARAAIGKETQILDQQPDVMVMKERKYPRKTFLLKRGVYDAPDYEVKAETPEQLFPMPADLPKNRLGLAQWLLHPDNPLFVRVTVNRFWQNTFGRGLVRTTADFGNQGELPSHPELLDWLSVWFRKSGWDVKALEKMMVTSATYRQSSVAGGNELQKDPENKLYTRSQSGRVSAEQARDNALASSGLLVRSVGGPGVYPYQPDGIWEALATRNAVKYVRSTGDSLYRRSMYTYWKRSAPPPMMLNFDASERHFCSVKRQKTSTPLQALVTLNDPQFVEAARMLAQKAMEANPAGTDAVLQYFFKSVVSRKATNAELDVLRRLYQEEEADFRANPLKCKALLAVGDAGLNKKLSAPQLAAYSVVASTVMNFDEVLIKR